MPLAICPKIMAKSTTAIIPVPLIVMDYHPFFLFNGIFIVYLLIYHVMRNWDKDI